MVLELVLAFLATVSFSLLFQVEKEELVYCGGVGVIGWFVYKLLENNRFEVSIATFCSSLFVTLFSRFLASFRKKPMTIFLTTGIITLVPGYSLYYTIFNIISYKNYEALHYGIETLKVAGAISLGIVLIIALPRKIFNFNLKNSKI